ncbi:MAG: hypothetical protein ACT4PS_01610 [Betaproteobacteria bacterium]
MTSSEERRKLAQQLRDDAALIVARLEGDGAALAQRLKRAADLLDGRAEQGIEPLRYPDS